MATQLKIAVATFLVLCIVFEDARLVLAGKRRKSKYIWQIRESMRCDSSSKEGTNLSIKMFRNYPHKT